MVELEQHIISTDSIRQKARQVIDRSGDLLTLDYSSIENVLVPKLNILRKVPNPVPSKFGKENSIQSELGSTLFFDVVNFCFKDPTNSNEYRYDAGDKIITRSQGLFAALKKSDVDWNNLISVSALSPEKWLKMTQITDKNTLYLGEERGVRIRGFAKRLVDHGFKSVVGYLSSTRFETENLLFSLSESGYFTDEFLKRAQLTVRMLDDIFKSHDLAGFRNSNTLTAMADYRIPQVYYNLGPIRLSKRLEDILMREEPIKPDSREEMALRAPVITISQIVASKMGITEADADFIQWSLSQEMANKKEFKIPHMLVATDKY